MKLELRKFDITRVKDDRVVVLIGKRDTGKSFLVKDLLYYHNDIPIGTVISGTERSNHFYSEIVPSMFIYDRYTPKIVDNVMKRQRMVIDKANTEKSVYGQCNIDPRAFLILDDCLFDASWTKDMNIREIFMNGRHYRLFFIVTMQYPLGVPPNLRTNIDYVFILRENIVGNRRRIYDNFAGMFPSFDVFCQVMDQCTENYECLVIDNTSKSNRLEDNVFWYKADNHPPYRIGAPQFWINNQQFLQAREEEERFDPQAMRQKKNGPNIRVQKSF